MTKISKRRFFLFSILFPFVFFKTSWGHPRKPNLLVVWKKKRILALYRNSKMIKAYRIRLGFNPEGLKQNEGDGKTPEGKYYITHFKELFILDGKPSNLDENDIGRRNTIINLLQQWNLLKVVNPDSINEPTAPLSQIKIIPFKEKKDLILTPKYNIGNNNTEN